MLSEKRLLRFSLPFVQQSRGPIKSHPFVTSIARYSRYTVRGRIYFAHARDRDERGTICDMYILSMRGVPVILRGELGADVDGYDGGRKRWVVERRRRRKGEGYRYGRWAVERAFLSGVGKRHCGCIGSVGCSRCRLWVEVKEVQVYKDDGQEKAVD